LPNHFEGTGVSVTHPKTGGFTLLELMIALAVAAIVAAFAVPAYRAHVNKGHRMEAATAVLRAAQFVEATRLEQSDASEALTLAAGIDQAPAQGKAVYKLRVLPDSGANGGYAIEAEPVPEGPMERDACGVFVIDGAGQRGNRVDAELDASQSAACWSSR
jgi:type IV pilus assembly protein PilE